MLYFDHNASTPPRPEALAAVREAESIPGNPSSQHAEGRRARAALEESREQVGGILAARATEIVFTSGGTESNRLAIEGALESAPRTERWHAVVAGIEHPSVLEVYARLAERGVIERTIVDAGADGRVLPEAVALALRPNTRLVSVQHANNETGAVQHVSQIAARLDEHAHGRPGAPAPWGRPFFHVDAVQSAGKLRLRPLELGADLLTISSHKLGGPRGAGALWIRPKRGYEPPLRGGPQERRLRPGTENLPAIRGFARALELADASASAGGEDGARLGKLIRKRLESELEGVALNGGPRDLLDNTVNVSFRGVSAELLVIRLDQEGVAASMGSACASGSREPSHVLRSMGLEPWRIQSAIRLSTGWTTRREDVDELIAILARVVSDLRARSAASARA